MTRVTASVAVLYKSVPQYRAPFYSLLRERLKTEAIDLRLVYGDASPELAARRDSVDLPWAEFRQNRFVGIGSRSVIWQPLRGIARQVDLVIVEQATRLLANYPLLVSQFVGAARVAFWGHGANLQRHTASRSAEVVKRAVSRLPHWWFAYTAGVGRYVESLGYPADRITVVQNALDTSALQRWRSEMPDDAETRVRAALDLGDGPVAATLGGLYSDKRLAFLLAACDRVRDALPGFRLVVIGDGPARSEFESLAAGRSYVRVLGAVFDADKVQALAPASLVLNPGAVGLTIVDSFALEVPLVTTSIDYHGPEIEYLDSNTNGVIVEPTDDPVRYADAVIELFDNPARIARLREGCRRSAAKYTIEAMVERFAGGIVAALDAPSRWFPRND